MQIAYEVRHRPYFEVVFMIRDITCECALFMFHILTAATAYSTSYRVQFKIPLLLLIWIIIIAQFAALSYYVARLVKRYYRRQLVRAAF